MISKTLIIVNELGLHARAAAKVVACAKKFKSNIILRKKDKDADAKSIMKILMLSASKGSHVEITIDGKDQREAMCSIAELFEKGFDENV